MSPQSKSHLALFIANLMYGANYVIAKGLMPDRISPNGFILFRVLGAALLFWSIYVFWFEKVNKKDFGRIALCALFGVATNQLCFFNGLMLTSPVNASVIMTVTPILVLVLSIIFLQQKITSLQVIGVVIGAVGSIAFTLSNSDTGFASAEGDIFIFINAASYALYLTMVKPLMRKYRPITVISWVFTFGLLYVIAFPLSIPEASSVQWENFDGVTYLKFMFVVIGVTFLPYLLNIYSMKRLSPYITAVYIYIQPLLAAGFIFLFAMVGEEDYSGDFSVLKMISALTIFAGVYLVIRPPKAKPTA